jgi:hypothetical protein
MLLTLQTPTTSSMGENVPSSGVLVILINFIPTDQRIAYGSVRQQPRLHSAAHSDTCNSSTPPGLRRRPLRWSPPRVTPSTTTWVDAPREMLPSIVLLWGRDTMTVDILPPIWTVQ